MRLFFQELKRFRDFSGKSSRREFWTFFLGLMVVGIVFDFAISGLYSINMEQALGGSSPNLLVPVWSIPIILLMFPAMVLFFISQLATGVRRLRDAGFNPLWILLGLVPLGVIALIIMWTAPTKISDG